MNEEWTKSKVSRNRGSVLRQQNGFWSGEVYTPHGIVAVAKQDLREGSKFEFTMFRFVHNGFEYTLRYKHALTQIGIVTAAGRFVRQIVGEGSVKGHVRAGD